MRSIYELNVCLKIKFWISSKNCPRILKKTTSVCENQGKISDKKYAFILNDISTQMWKPINHLKNVRLKICPKQTLQLNPLSIWYWNKCSLTINYCHLILNSTPSRRSRRKIFHGDIKIISMICFYLWLICIFYYRVLPPADCSVLLAYWSLKMILSKNWPQKVHVRLVWLLFNLWCFVQLINMGQW